MTITKGIDKIAWGFWGLWWFILGDRFGMKVYKLWQQKKLPQRWLDEVDGSEIKRETK